MDTRKDKVTPKTEKKRTLTVPIFLLFSLMVAGSIPGCSQSLRLIPAEIRGKYATTDPEYKNQFFELGPVLITLGFDGGKFKHYNVKRIEKEIVDHRTLYTILCANESEGEEFNFSFFVDSAGEGIIHFKNKPQVAWEKQEYLTTTLQIHKSGTKLNCLNITGLLMMTSNANSRKLTNSAGHWVTLEQQLQQYLKAILHERFI